jgi:large subunit ribosomal protein L24
MKSKEKNKLSIVRGDIVKVMSGKEKSNSGKVLRVYPDKERIVIEGVNFIKRHTRPNQKSLQQGGIVEREAPIHYSKVMLVCPKCSKTTRVRRTREEKGKIRRICLHCEGVF